MEVLVRVIAAVIGSACFAIIFRTPRRYFAHTVLVGFISCFGMTVLPSTWHVAMSTSIVTLVVASVSNGFARWTKTPAQGFLIPGIIFLVPGAAVYRAFSKGMEHDVAMAVELMLSAVTTTLGISVGLLLANWVVPSKKSL